MNSARCNFLIATIAGLSAALLVGVVGLFGGVFACTKLFTGDVGAWNGIFIGPLVGLIFAIPAFAFTFRWIAERRDTPSD